MTMAVQESSRCPSSWQALRFSRVLPEDIQIRGRRTREESLVSGGGQGCQIVGLGSARYAGGVCEYGIHGFPTAGMGLRRKVAGMRGVISREIHCPSDPLRRAVIRSINRRLEE